MLPNSSYQKDNKMRLVIFPNSEGLWTWTVENNDKVVVSKATKSYRRIFHAYQDGLIEHDRLDVGVSVP